MKKYRMNDGRQRNPLAPRLLQRHRFDGRRRHTTLFYVHYCIARDFLPLPRGSALLFYSNVSGRESITLWLSAKTAAARGREKERKKKKRVSSLIENLHRVRIIRRQSA